ncbi:autotransporter outer membrane beta-barrel domain-containing protein [Phascolarctobacterium faecium]|uniref:autotransporter outer membrane beta-barrel domain-containing protein n=1 Tax=Phascolarctobacterium faecium TaxID=33025 RepID=UPI00266EDF78|nr:autotransporter outer membrane beta-barrel domain-containing protein [Phascolarctobacterium faecium]
MYIWGGTSVLPMAEASMVDGNTVHGVAKSYSDNSTLTGANIVIYAGSSETTDITAEGKLKLENTSANVPVIGTVSNGKINLNGDTITVENTGNDYSNSVVFAESGSNITFNNDTTNIISSTNNRKKFIGGAGNIVFSDTATTLNIGNMNESSSISGCIGITVSGQGSFAFNNTDGIVNIGGFAGTVFDMSGGTIKLEGAETNVSSNGDFLLYLSNQRYGGTQNKIDFNAQKTTIKGTSKGIYADTNSINNHVSFKGDVDIEVQGNGYYDGIAVALGTNAALDLNFDKGATIKAHQNSAADDLFAVNLAAGSDLKVKGDIDLISTAVGGGTGNNYGIYSAGGDAAFDGMRLQVTGGKNVYGVYLNGGKADVEGALVVDAQGQDYVFGINNANGSKIDIKGVAAITVNSANTENAYGIYSTGANSDIAFHSDTILTTNGPAAVQVEAGGKVLFARGLVSESGAYIFAVDSGSNIKINSEGGGLVKVIGDIFAQDGGTLDFKMDNSESYLEGAADGVNMDMQNGSVWRVTGDSNSQKLNLENAAVDLTTDGVGATKFVIADYSGTGGNFIMDTDLAAETSDKVNITNAAAGTTYVQVKDASLVNGHTVTGAKNLLLITDASQNVNFVGKNLNAGGLWDVTPTLENGENVTLTNGSQGTKDQWYLTKMAKQVNNDTKVLLESGDGNYALWRNTGDTLRKRLGDLHNYRDTKVESDGIWSRYIGGKFGSGNFDGSFNMYQLGYDKAANAKSIYGFAVENGSGHTSYSYGSGKDKLFAGSIYGTWHGDNSSYTDVVARFGQFDTDIRSYGDYPDKAKAKSRAYSLSVEYGKTIELNKAQGTFIEPQAQLIIGRLGSSSYTTDRGNNVYMGGVNSCIGRLGVVAGKKDASGNDVYLKVNMLHEFGGNRDVRMLAGNGETLSESQDYGDTWFELGLGGNIKLGNSSHLYGDIERSFGADIQKKWQVNVGVRFEF